MTDPTSSTQPQDHTQDSDSTLTPDQRQKEALAAFTATLHSVGTNLEAPLRERATIINTNALSLERQEAEAGLKEIGDVQNWAEMIERDLLVLESMMDEVEGVDDSASEEDARSVRDEEMEVEINGNGNGNGVPNGDEVQKKEKRRSWFSWW
ncbi:uncharacterized protein N7503_008423 [Penicillium pulvis]|uniref:uncharacterized protein n=1 Tax=Penicillium pulvis TaxID=1562058 RepID=UPI002546A199|nr:uncharacterized protein N7503_008423 [Penicillium pulvis]KAJ5792445.1 hypothetical protein N7503_008423 [Penicillium pulvis]